MNQSSAYSGSLLDFVKVKGNTLMERSLPHWNWVEARRGEKIWPYEKALLGPVGGRVLGADEFLEGRDSFVNFSSQDYLGLSARKELREAAIEAISRFGIHSAGSPVLTGRNPLVVELENLLCELLSMEACLLFPTGWGAGFGALAGLAKPEDIVILDRLSHNCVQEGARHCGARVRKFRHNDIDSLHGMLRQERETSSTKGIFIVVESLYSMDSDSPDLGAVLRLAKDFDAIVICDIAHDFGAMGETGLGLLESLGGLRPDVIIGSFSKTFATNGGFVAASRSVRQYLAAYAPPYIFSNAISPIQAAVALKSLAIAFSPAGPGFRESLAINVQNLRRQFASVGQETSGLPSPIVPVFVGSENRARLASREIFSRGLLANLVEFPAVPRGKARFRFQVMATHREDDVMQAAAVLAETMRDLPVMES